MFPKDLRQLINPPYPERTKVDRFFSPWQRRADKLKVSSKVEFLMRVGPENYLTENSRAKTDRANLLESLEVRVPYRYDMS